MRTLISYFRFIRVLFHMVVVVLSSYILLPIIGMQPWRKFTHQRWSKNMLRAIGAEVIVNSSLDGEWKQPNTMFVQNHVSWLDTMVMNSVYGASYVGKVEMLQWKLLKNVIIAGETIFIDRKNKRELVLANKKIAAALEKGGAMGLFAEGTTSDGTTVLPFHASIFESAILAKSRIVPVVVRYRNEDGSLCREVTFSKKKWMESVWNTLRMKKIIIKVDVLEPVYATDFENREAISDYMYEKISKVYHSDLKKV